MAWRISLLVVALVALGLAGGALYVHQVDRYPLQAVPPATLNPARSCSQPAGMIGAGWSAPDGVTYRTKRGCVVYVRASHQAAPNPQRAIVERANAHNRREREIEWLAFAAAALVLTFAVAAGVFARRPRIAERLA